MGKQNWRTRRISAELSELCEGCGVGLPGGEWRAAFWSLPESTREVGHEEKKSDDNAVILILNCKSI